MSSELFHQIQNILKNHSKILSVKNYKNKKLYFYNKELITEKGYNLYSDIGLFRSIITNNENKLLMISPSKSMKYEHFIREYPNIYQPMITDNDNQIIYYDSTEPKLKKVVNILSNKLKLDNLIRKNTMEINKIII
jgi:hypothetical protein